MRVFPSIKHHDGHCTRPLVEEITSTLDGQGHRVVCVARDLERWGGLRYSCRELMARTFDLINACDAVLVELSEKRGGHRGGTGTPGKNRSSWRPAPDRRSARPCGASPRRSTSTTGRLNSRPSSTGPPPGAGGESGGRDAGFYYRDLLFRFLAALRRRRRGGDPLDVLAATYHRQAAAAWETLAREMAARGEARDVRALHRLFFSPSDEARGFVYRTLRLGDDGMELEVYVKARRRVQRHPPGDVQGGVTGLSLKVQMPVCRTRGAQGAPRA